MTLYALDDVDDALAATRSFLTPVDRTTWVKLAVVVFFVGGPGANFNTFQYTFGGDGNGGPTPDVVVPPGVWLLVAAVVAVGLVLGLAFALVGSVMEFVFVESLRAQEVSVRRYWGRRWRQGVRLLGFRLLVAFFVFGSVVLLSLPFVLSFVGGGPVDAALPLAVVFVLLPVFLVVAVVVGLVNGFTTVFVVPIMVLTDCGVLAGWRRLWPTITAQWVQYLAYVVASFFLSVLGGLLVGIVTAVAAVVLLVPFGVLFAVAFGLFAVVSQPIGIGAFVVVGLLFGLAILIVVALAQVPVQTYLRYYALLVLGDVDADLDLIPDQRAAIRDSSTSSV